MRGFLGGDNFQNSEHNSLSQKIDFYFRLSKKDSGKCIWSNKFAFIFLLVRIMPYQSIEGHEKLEQTKNSDDEMGTKAV